MIDRGGELIKRKEGSEEKIERMKRDGKAFCLCEDTIKKIKDLSMESDSVAGINWLIEHYQMEGEEVARLQDENKKLKCTLSAFKRRTDEYKQWHGKLEKENTTLKNDLINWENKYSGLETHHNIKFTEMRKENRELEEYKDNAVNEIDDLKKDNDLLMKLEDQKREIIAKKTREIAELKRKNKAAESQVISLNEDYSNCCINLEEIRNDLKESKEVNKELKAYKDAADERNTELNNANEGNSGAIARQETKIEELKESVKYFEELDCSRVRVIDRLHHEKAELKESLRTIQEMDKEEPCAQVETLLEDVQRLTTENRKLEDEMTELKTQKSEYQNAIKNFMNSAVQNNYKTESLKIKAAELDGALHQANKILKMLCK